MLSFDAFTTVGAIDLARNYFLATAIRGFPVPAVQQTLLADAGGTSVLQVPLAAGIVPAMTGVQFGGTAIVFLEGTTNANQIASSLAASVSVQSAPWPGEVARTWSLLANAVHASIVTDLGALNFSRWLLCGHSLGGSVLALLTDLFPDATSGIPKPAEMVCFGSPKSGDRDYALAPHIPRLRWTNEGDPIPLLPPSLIPNHPWFFELPVVTLELDWLHWGRRALLFEDGAIAFPPTESSGLGAFPSQLLINRLLTDEGWIGPHELGSYALRLRRQIPIEFPADEADPDYPAVELADAANEALNTAFNVVWDSTDFDQFNPATTAIKYPECS